MGASVSIGVNHLIDSCTPPLPIPPSPHSSDYGFVQTPRGFSANMVYQPSFGHGTEGVSAWTTSAAGAPSARFSMATTTSFAAKPSFSMSSNDADGEIAAVNRGIAGSGFYLEAGKPYEVEAWVWAASSFTGFLELRERDTNESLARAEFQVAGTGPPWGATWLKVNATLTPTKGTHCPEVTPSQHDVDCPGTNGLDRICVRCGGELLVGAKGKAMTNLGYVSLMPGAWGRVVAKDGSLTAALKSAGDVLTEMGITLMRSGGSVSQSMRWKDWRGPAWNRQAYVASASASQQHAVHACIVIVAKNFLLFQLFQQVFFSKKKKHSREH